jgi:hypothetical protein
MGKRKTNWPAKAFNPDTAGDLTALVRRKYGAAGFTERGTIKESILRDLIRMDGHPGKMANLALNARGFRRRK